MSLVAEASWRAAEDTSVGNIAGAEFLRGVRPFGGRSPQLIIIMQPPPLTTRADCSPGASEQSIWGWFDITLSLYP